jgi:hypothetical protein
VQVAAARHRRGQGPAAAAAAPRQRAQRGGGRRQRGRDARHHLGANARLGQRLQLFFEAAEDARVAPLQAHHGVPVLRMAHEQGVDAGLARGVAEPALADVDPARLRRQRAQRRVGQRVVQHDLGLRQALRAAHGDQVGCAGAGADEDDRSRVHASTPSTSSAPLVRWLAGSTTISAPPTRLSA